MEELSKSQIILLVLLVSFVTSIATGIVTVSLMDQASPTIAQTVNRVIERTVEKVVPSPATQAASAVTTEKTVVVKETDLIVQAVEKMTPSLVRVSANTADGLVFLGLGVVIDAEGSIIVDAAALGATETASLTFADGSTATARVASRAEGTGFAVLASATSTAEGEAISFSPASISAERSMLGQVVVALSGRNIPRITDGLVTALIPRKEGKEPIVDTNILSDFIMAGSPLINSDGALVGVSTSVSRASSQRGFISAMVLVERDPAEDEEGGEASPE